MQWLLTLVLLLSQSASNRKPAFEVASIKASTPGLRESMANQPGRFAANNLTLRQLIGFAYGSGNSQPPQIVGGPNWIADAQWTIEAKIAERDSATGPEAIALRLQALLEDRFALKLHREMREQPVYALVVDKNGLKIPAVDPPPPPVPGQAPPAPPRVGPGGALSANFMPQPGRIMAGPGVILASAVTTSEIALALNRAVDRPIVDRTNLTGYFNMRIHFVTDAAATDSAEPSIFTAIQEQLGLKLEAAKNAMEVLVIDSVEKPMEN
jgi:uncharacterized protein (TIGR03435 family)